MKRIISLTLVLMLTITTWLPVQGLAQDNKALEQAIGAIKSKIQIPEGLTEFNYSAGTDRDKTVWYLDWSSKDGLEGNLNVRVDQDGKILGYNYYKPYDYDDSRKFPKVDRQQAQEIAETFIERMQPGLLSCLEPVDEEELEQIGRTHRFGYVRSENGIPYRGNTVSVDVNSETGEVQNYSYNWNDDLSFPAAEGILSREEAEESFKEQLGLRLIYQYNYDNEQENVYAVYVPAYDFIYAVDAINGERIRTNRYYGIYPGRMGMEKAAAQDSGIAGAAQLTPEERQAVEKMSSLISRQRAETIARGIKQLEISQDYEVTRVYLQKNYNVSDSYTWELNFQRSDDQNGPPDIWVRIDAQNGDLKGYSRYLDMDGKKEGKYSQDEARKAVEDFLKAVHGDKLQGFEYDPAYDGGLYPLRGDTNPTTYNFRYIRKVNGVLFPANSMYVGFDAVNGKVMTFSMDWFDVEFPEVGDALDIEEVYEKMFEEIGLELLYSDIYSQESRPADYEKPKIRLVYNLKQTKPVIFDAFTGQILDRSGKPYVDKKAAEYTDISGHFAEEQITALARYGITLQGTEFRPDDNILQKDFMRLLVKAMGYYGSFEDDDMLDDMYNRLIREKVITSDEKKPEALVTREEAVKFMIKALGYQTVADIEGIFVTGFDDQGSISSQLVGYVAIAKGLGIVGGSGGSFNPKDNLTRAQAAIMFYNHLI